MESTMTSADILEMANAEARRIAAIFPPCNHEALVLCYLAGRVSVVEEYSAVLQARVSIGAAKVEDAPKI